MTAGNNAHNNSANKVFFRLIKIFSKTSFEIFEKKKINKNSSGCSIRHTSLTENIFITE